MRTATTQNPTARAAYRAALRDIVLAARLQRQVAEIEAAAMLEGF
tara:strand:- start:5448 stop:5582 length:135 start_codon:yes stop_codon:yes gene_type:complete